MMNGFKKIVLVSTAALVLGLGAQAHALLLDDFSTALTPAVESGVGDGQISGSNQNINFGTDLTNNVRLITVETTGLNVGFGTGHTSAEVSGGLYQHSQDADIFGYSLSKWTFDSADFSVLGPLQVEVFSANLAGGILSITLFDGGGGSDTKSVSLGAGPSSPIFTGFAVDLTDVNMALMKIDGTQVASLDVTVDIVGAQPVPEPSTMILLSSGLIGLIGYRMKKNA